MREIKLKTLVVLCGMVLGLLSSTIVIAQPGEETDTVNAQPVSTTDASDNSFSSELNSGLLSIGNPLSLGALYSANYGTMMETKGGRLLTTNNAVGLGLQLGANQRRIDGSWGWAIFPQQRVKLSAENLTQYTQFKFNAGDTNRWVSQNAIGGAYQYLIPNSFLNDLNAGAYYSGATNVSLPSRSNGAATNDRHIAGAKDANGSVGADITPAYGSLFGLQVGYDSVKYAMRYEHDRNDSGMGLNLSWQQLITKQLKFNMSASELAIYENYQAGLSWMFNLQNSDYFEVGASAMRLINKHSIANDTLGLLSLSYGWHANSQNSADGYSLADQDSHDNLSQWATMPAVYMDQTLAIRDQRNR